MLFKKRLSCLFLLTLLFSPGLAQEPLERAKESLKLATQSGSRLAWMEARFLNRKYDLDLKIPPRNVFSRWGLQTDALGGPGFSLTRNTRGLQLLTGARAIEESLQLNTISSQKSSPDDRTVRIETLANLEIESHPWSAMLEELGTEPSQNPILNLVPADHFMVHFSSTDGLLRLEDYLQKLGQHGAEVLHLEEALRSRESLEKTLGIPSIQGLGEFLLVSEDLNFLPSTHYAVITPYSKRAAKLTRGKHAGRVGDYVVVSSSESLLERIKACHRGRFASMAGELDYHYANAVIDAPRDGMVYLSEAFILKLVSAPYRINAARRLDAIKRLSEAQYAVWAYKSLTGRWPSELASIGAEGYSKASYDSRLSLGPEGLVRDAEWGSLWDLRALSDVPIDLVSESEERVYEEFTQEYQKYWSQFFDPIGMGVRVGDHLSFHTIVLPLIENTAYNRFSTLASGPKIDFDGHQALARNAPISVFGRLNFEDILLEFGARGRKEGRRGAREALNRSLNEDLRANPPLDAFSILGDEWSFFFPPQSMSKVKRASDGAVLSVKRGQEPHFSQFLDLAFPAKRIGTVGSESYRVVPFIFSSKLYLYTRENFLYIAPEEETIRELCQWKELDFTRFWGEEEIGRKHNVLLLGDFRNSRFLAGFFQKNLLRGWRRELMNRAGYMVDQEILSKALGDELQVSALLPSDASHYYGLELRVTPEGVLLDGLPFEGTVRSTLMAQEKVKRAVARVTEPLALVTTSLDFTEEGISTHILLKARD